LVFGIHSPLDTKPQAPLPIADPTVISFQGIRLIAGSRKISSIREQVSEQNTKLTNNYKTNNSIPFKVGVGVVIKSGISISIILASCRFCLRRKN
jgi:hypothetical protein